MSEKTVGKIAGDGRVYFSFGIGLKFRLIQKNGAECDLEIKDCFLSRDSETEYYYCEKDGKTRIEKPFSAARISFLLKNQCKQVISEGAKPRELPLLREEVNRYYRNVIDPILTAQSRASKLLKNTAYYEFDRQRRVLELDKILNKAPADADTQITELKSKQRAILKELNLSESVISEEIDCAKCFNRGLIVVFGGRYQYSVPCECAEAQKNQIKYYNAKFRLKGI